MPPQSPQERRRFARVSFASEVSLHQQNRHWQCHLIDISLKGALLTLPQGLEVKQGDKFTLVLKLTDMASVEMDVAVAHQRGTAVGFHCHQIDIDSMSHLRRMIELNMADPDCAERELKRLVTDN